MAMFWRSSGSRKVYDLCLQMELPEGLLISHDFNQPVRYIRSAVFQQKCYEGTTPMLNSNVNLVLNTFSESLPLVKRLWREFTTPPNNGTFVYSVVPIVYSIAILAVITWFFTIFVLTNYTIKPSFLLQLLTILSSVYMLITVIKSIVVLHNQQRQGYLHGEAVLNAVNDTLYLSIIDMIVVLSLLILQVQVVMRLFLRQSDKRLIFYVGTSAAVVSQTLWGITKFHNFHAEAEAGKIIPALTYLLRIAMGMCYAAIFTAFLLIKIKQIIANRHIWLISLLTLVFIYAPVAFFIADVSNTWVYALSEIFSVVTYVICVVIPWEWCNKYNVIRRMMEKEGVLGRRFYEDELYELDRFELFVEEEAPETPGRQSFHDDVSSDGDDDNEGERPQNLHSQSSSSNTLTKATSGELSLGSDEPNHSKFDRFVNGMSNAKNMFLDITDKIIATGLAVPRSVSVSSSFGPAQQPIVERLAEAPLAQLERHASERRRSRERAEMLNTDASRERVDNLRSNDRSVSFADVENAGRNRRDVFVYSTRDVVLKLDESD